MCALLGCDSKILSPLFKAIGLKQSFLENYRDDTFPKTSKVEKNESVKKGIKSFVKR